MNQKQAQDLDQELMDSINGVGYSLEQLMELAGLAVAQAIHDYFASLQTGTDTSQSLLVIVGPGNNGGDALVAARHFFLFKTFSSISIWCPNRKVSKFQNLLRQLESFQQIPIFEQFNNNQHQFTHVLDGLFGFSFKPGPIRAPFDEPFKYLKSTSKEIISIDIPSGWDVEKGPIEQDSITPILVISLTAPKLGVANHFKGAHYVGGRFVPPDVAIRYKLEIPAYSGYTQFERLR